MRGAIILAGGQSSRFQDGSGQWLDKALAVLSGKPLLAHIVENVKPVVDEIIICVNDATRGFHYLKIMEEYLITNVKTCIDIKFPHIQGPFAAIATGLKGVNADYCIIVPCDMPFIRPSVVDYLLKLVEKLDTCVPIHPDGNIETLMFSCKREGTAKVAEVLCLLGRSRPVDIMRASSKIKFVSTVSELRKIDPGLKSFININFRSDLINLPIRVPREGPITKSIELNLMQPSSLELHLLESIARKYANEEYLEIIDDLSEILSNFERKGFNFWEGVLWETLGKIYRKLALSREKSDEIKEHYIRSGEAFERAALEYAMEASIYEEKQIKFLLESTWKDRKWCSIKRDEVATLYPE
ncbi:MAG: molybdenum cofactor guanylyltransferase [Candidatus Bathyarchaeia archaeon]